MGKTPDTIAGKLLKVRENKARIAAAKQGLVLTKLKRETDGRPYVLHYADRTANGGFPWSPDGRQRMHKMNLAELETALRDRQRQPVSGLA